MRIGLIIASSAVLSLACGAPLEATGPLNASIGLSVSDGDLLSASLTLTHAGADCPKLVAGASINGTPLTELDSGGTILTTTNLVSPETRCTPGRYQALFIDHVPPTRDEVVRFDFGSQGFVIESAQALKGRSTVRASTVRRGEPLVVALPPVAGMTAGTLSEPFVFPTDEEREPTPDELASVSPGWKERPLGETTLSFPTAGLEPGSWTLLLDAKLPLALDRCDGFAKCELELRRQESITFVVTP